MTATFERALAGYDRAFRERLQAALISTIVATSTIHDGPEPICCLRTGESIDATVDVLIMLMAMVADHDVPSHLQEHCDAIAEKVRKAVAQARAEGVADCLGGARGGHA